MADMSKRHRVTAVRFNFGRKYTKVLAIGKSPRGTNFIFNAVQVLRDTESRAERTDRLSVAVHALMDSPLDV